MAKNSSPIVQFLEPVSVPLSRLRHSPKNVRPVDATGIESLAQSILRVGLVQSLVVVAQKDGRSFEVVAGGRRLSALQALREAKKIANTYPVPCLLIDDELATTASLAENIERLAMHPADQLAAFKRLADEGRSLDDIAADFGVTPLTVRRRLKLAVVSPRLLEAFRAGEVTLDQLSVLALNEDHVVQDAAFFDAPEWDRDPRSLRRRIEGEAVHAGRDRIARFVGLKAYKTAGGDLRYDLFADERDPGYIEDMPLLQRLAQKKLEAFARKAQTIDSSCGAWVDAHPGLFRHQLLHEYRRPLQTRRTPSEAAQARLAQIESRMTEIDVSREGGEALTNEQEVEFDEEAERLSDEAEAINEASYEIDEAHQPYVGSVALIDEEGKPVLETGLLRIAEAAQWDIEAGGVDEGGGKAQGGAKMGKPSLSGSLVERLTTHQTAALQAELCNSPTLALVALVNGLALGVLTSGYSHGSCIKISARPSYPASWLTEELAASPAGKALQSNREEWLGALPDSPDQWFDALRTWAVERLLGLLAFLVAVTVDVVQVREDASTDDTLLRAAAVDLGKWWAPTADAYFAHVPKAHSLEVAKALAPDAVSRLAKLKKDALAGEVSALALAAQWLPPILRGIEGAVEQ